MLDPDGVLPDSERQRALRSLRMSQLPDGTWRLVMRATAESGSAIKAVLDAFTAPRVRFIDDPADGDDSAAGAGAAVSAATSSGADATVPADERSPEQKRHDALVAMVEAHAASGGAPVAGGEVPRLVLTGTIEAFSAYLRDVEHPVRTLTVEHTGAIVPIETVSRLVCNGVVQRAVTDSRGQVLELGRTVRLFTPAQRRALAVQYGGCATPGCGAPVAWTETHHVVWWQLGGPTDVANGILLCSHCHHEVHAGRLVVVGSPGDWRVVSQLRPADPYARATRSIAAERSPGELVTAPAAAAASLAVRIPNAIAAPLALPRELADAVATSTVRRPRGACSPVEARIRRMPLDAGRRGSGGRRTDAVRPWRHVVLRT